MRAVLGERHHCRVGDLLAVEQANLAQVRAGPSEANNCGVLDGHTIGQIDPLQGWNALCNDPHTLCAHLAAAVQLQHLHARTVRGKEKHALVGDTATEAEH